MQHLLTVHIYVHMYSIYICTYTATVIKCNRPQAISLCIHFIGDEIESQSKGKEPTTLSWPGKDTEGIRDPVGNTQHTVNHEEFLFL